MWCRTIPESRLTGRSASSSSFNVGASVPLVRPAARTTWGQSPRLSSRARLDRSLRFKTFWTQESAGCGNYLWGLLLLKTDAELHSAGQPWAAVPAWSLPLACTSGTLAPTFEIRLASFERVLLLELGHGRAHVSFEFLRLGHQGCIGGSPLSLQRHQLLASQFLRHFQHVFG